MKKTLQKELKYQCLPNENIMVSGNKQQQQSNERLTLNSQSNASFTSSISFTGDTTTQINNLKLEQSKDKTIDAQAQYGGAIGESIYKSNNLLTNTTKSQSHLVHSASYANNMYSISGNNNSGSINRKNVHLSNLHDDVNFKYLKHVVLKFITSREYEVIMAILLFKSIKKK